MEADRLLVVQLPLRDAAETIDGLGHIGVFDTQDFLPDGPYLFQHAPSVGCAALRAMYPRELVEVSATSGWTFPARAESPAQLWFCFGRFVELPPRGSSRSGGVAVAALTLP